jgi:hypothetical protein
MVLPGPAMPLATRQTVEPPSRVGVGFKAPPCYLRGRGPLPPSATPLQACLKACRNQNYAGEARQGFTRRKPSGPNLASVGQVSALKGAHCLPQQGHAIPHRSPTPTTRRQSGPPPSGQSAARGLKSAGLPEGTRFMGQWLPVVAPPAPQLGPVWCVPSIVPPPTRCPRGPKLRSQVTLL